MSSNTCQGELINGADEQRSIAGENDGKLLRFVGPIGDLEFGQVVDSMWGLNQCQPAVAMPSNCAGGDMDYVQIKQCV